MENNNFQQQYDLINECEKNNQVVVSGYDGLKQYDIIDFLSEENSEDILNKLYRTKQHIISHGRHDTRWVNDYALVQLFEYIYEQNQKMKTELSFYADIVSDYESKIVEMTNIKNKDHNTSTHNTPTQPQKTYTRMGENFETGQNIGI